MFPESACSSCKLSVTALRELTKDPPMLELWMAEVIGTILGKTARISAVGASNLGFTSTKYRSPLANWSCCRSKGCNPLHDSSENRSMSCASHCFTSIKTVKNLELSIAKPWQDLQAFACKLCMRPERHSLTESRLDCISADYGCMRTDTSTGIVHAA